MDDKSSARDEDLLARLNVLKQSHISLEHASKSLASPVFEGADKTPEDLIARFQKLHGREATAVQEHGTDSSTDNEEEISGSPTIDELLAELGPEEDYMLDHSEITESQALLAEASSLPYLVFSVAA